MVMKKADPLTGETEVFFFACIAFALGLGDIHSCRIHRSLQCALS